jgi:hypothetical protein
MSAREVWSRISWQTAFQVELVAVLGVTVFSLVPPPFTSSVEGPVTFEDGIEIDVGGRSIDYLDQPVLPDIGATVLVTYQDRVPGQTVVSVTVGPGSSAAVTYLTDAGRGYERWLWLSRVAALAVGAGLIVALGAAARLFTLGRLEGTPARGLSAGIAPFTLLGAAALPAVVVSIPSSSLAMWVTFAAWPIAAIGALVARGVGRLHHEPEVETSRQARNLVLIAGAAGIVAWAAYILFRLYEFATTPLL